MELYARKVSIFDEQLIEEFVQEHNDYNEELLAGDCSLILGKGYLDYDNFYDWYKEEEKLNEEKDLKKGQVGCTTYLILSKETDSLIALLDIRHSLNFEHGYIYGHIGIDIRPKERNKGYYKEILKIALEIIKEFKIEKVIISCEYTNIPSKKGIEHIFGKNYQSIPIDGTYYLVYQKDISR